MIRLLAGALAASALTAAAAHAQLEEVRVGLVAHDVVDHAEDGPQVSIELLWDTPEFLEPIWSPEPYLYGSFSTQGYTNLVATGLAWDGDITERLELEFSFGISYNDGVDDIVHLPPDDPYRIETASTRALLGSRWLWRTQLGADYMVTERWSAGVYYEHFSHGQILGNGRNQALDEVGVRIGWHFGD
ncbi:hypothetical protein E5163_14525 [Marinicauda algicola]|uniref:Acyloxyacyl hydrolase n=1 Tax=Marinicauda algicola TaxID=2029849 RepID=A0A4S2GX15_9PROT|nr:acyloxyacyl hydrolase [Marinicauda algicola]TGY87645.1 hypothetical protein E5163_14525 [Marinicauda algicola]